ncbi:MAG TPA: cytochrome c [Vicinamibacterales bacterium]|nr:cytochrome c [Vicinamibacterales bacterium]
MNGRFRHSSFVRASVTAAVAVLAVASTAAAQATAARQVTFSKDVAPILQRSCVSCHRPGEMAPMSLMTYEDARPWARAIKTRTASHEMPPFHIDKSIGITSFKNDPSLSDEEIATIARWVDQGAPRGNAADMPAPRQFADTSAWQFTPDIVVKFPAYKVPAAGPDLYGNLYADIPIAKDRYIQAIQTRAATAGSRKVVHHALTYAVDSDDKDVSGDDSAGVEGGDFLVEYASGKNAEVYTGDSGVLLQAGKKAMVSYHLHSVGEETDAFIEVAMKLHPEGYVPKHIRWSKQLAQPTSEIDIPGGTVARIDGYVVMHKAARILSFQPHMHIRGKRQCLELIYPTGGSAAKTEMISCTNFSYNWHLNYTYTDDVAPLIPAGTILHVITWHDNSQSNRANPDPKNWVGDGQRTIDEMGFAWIGWYDMTDDEYKTELEARKAERAKKTTQQQQQQQ